ncbi:DUF3322 domain-containing protein [uncultured Deefgea sp.]|uniref:DUF3322 domain-containing protein n=1 Tax=uncultured Deefgea sp. TaxID=1304914 RepID=UPI00261EF2C5|nr:DUF3322 domain-containing protein [uncultured Deefgea sp.]
MSWTSEKEIKAQLQKRWDKGELLASLLGDAPLFPLRIALKGPSSSELANQFGAVQDWIIALQQSRHFRLEMREIAHRIIGNNVLPQAVWLDDFAAALALIGKTREATRYQALLAQMPAHLSVVLLPWLQKRSLKLLDLGADWSLLLAVVQWLQAHPRPGIYLRQIDLPGVHSKLIEAHRGVLLELLDLVLPSTDINDAARGVSGFCQRYGFLDKPLRVRFRWADSGLGGTDVTLTQADFAQLNAAVERVLITENEINFLSLPLPARSMVIFGAGYGFDMLAGADWLHDQPIHYWGDIDTHGFAILDQLRAVFPLAQSLLMDQATLLAHQALWGVESTPVLRELPRLNPAETAVYQHLCASHQSGALVKQIRLEQERVGFAWVTDYLTLLGE